MIKFKVFLLLPVFDTNTYIIWDDDSRQALLIDPSLPSELLLDFILNTDLKVIYIINTHGHADHIGGNAYFREKLSAPVCIHQEDACMLVDAKANLSLYMESPINQPMEDRLLHDNDTLIIGKTDVKVIHTPGHTPGGICLYTINHLFSGDTLFYHDIGRTDLPGGSELLLVSSIKLKLFTLPEETTVLPGHGQASTILDEKLNNPYL